VKGEKNNTKKKGDICGPRVLDTDSECWNMIIEAKNYTSNHNRKLCEFYERSYAKTTNDKEIFIYLSLNKSQESFTYYSCRKENKVFLFINGLKKEDSTLNLSFLSKPGQLSMQELKAELSVNLPSINQSKLLFNALNAPKNITLYRYNSRKSSQQIKIPGTFQELINMARTLFCDNDISEIWEYNMKVSYDS
jgi:hypothetical protein